MAEETKPAAEEAAKTEAPAVEAKAETTGPVDYNTVEPLNDFDWDSLGKTKVVYKKARRSRLKDCFN